jgi:hypothetical protein
MAVAYVTEKSNVNTLSYVFSAMTAPSFQKRVVMMNHMHTENVPDNTNVKRFRKSGYLVASAQTEATAKALAADGELTDTYVDGTAASISVVSAQSDHLKRFGGEDGSLSRFATEQGAAIARFVDDDALSLAANFSQTKTCSTTATFTDLITAQTTIFNSNCPDLDIPLSFIGAPKSFGDLGIAAQSAGAAAYGNDVLLGIFKDTGGKPQANGYRGEIVPGIGGYMTTGFGTSGGDNQQLLVHPKWGIAGIFDAIIIVKTADKITEGFYNEIGSLYFYDVFEYHDAACVQFNSDAS